MKKIACKAPFPARSQHFTNITHAKIRAIHTWNMCIFNNFLIDD